MTWQLISTCPKIVGEHILVAVTGGPHGDTVCSAYWHPGDDSGIWEADWWLSATSPADYYASPIHNIVHGRVTHWMPMPAPPQEVAA